MLYYRSKIILALLQRFERGLLTTPLQKLIPAHPDAKRIQKL